MAGGDELPAGSAQPGETLAEILDGATGDYAVSGDAMRWSPDLAQESAGSPAGRLPGMDAGAGFGALIGLDTSGVRRLVSGALYTLTTAATDVVSELRSLTRGSGAPEQEPPGGDPAGADRAGG